MHEEFKRALAWFEWKRGTGNNTELSVYSGDDAITIRRIKNAVARGIITGSYSRDIGEVPSGGGLVASPFVVGPTGNRGQRCAAAKQVCDVLQCQRG